MTKDSIQIIPAIIPEDFIDLQEHCTRVKDYVQRVQVDIIDGKFAPRSSWPFVNDHGEFDKLVNQEKGFPYWEDLSFELDMMVRDPENIINDWIQAGAAAVIIHYGSTNNMSEIIERTKEHDVACGLAIRPSTPLEVLEDALDNISFVQLMGNDTIGSHGIELDEGVYEKLKDIRRMVGILPVAVDIGVNTETASRLIESGATKLVSGSTIFGSSDIEKTIEKLSEKH